MCSSIIKSRSDTLKKMYWVYMILIQLINGLAIIGLNYVILLFTIIQNNCKTLYTDI